VIVFTSATQKYVFYGIQILSGNYGINNMVLHVYTLDTGSILCCNKTTV